MGYEESDASSENRTEGPIDDPRIRRLPERLRWAMRGESVRSFAQRAGVSEGTLRNLLGGGIPRLDSLLRIADCANVAVRDLIEGDQIALERPSYIVEEEFHLVAVYDVHASAGHGAAIDHERVVSHIAFRKEWLQKEGLNAARLAGVSASGDSMEPTLREGDLLLIDTNQRQVGDDIYILRLGEHLLAKRVQSLYDGAIRISSDNPAYATEIVQPDEGADQVDIVGRVVWCGRKM